MSAPGPIDIVLVSEAAFLAALWMLRIGARGEAVAQDPPQPTKRRRWGGYLIPAKVVRRAGFMPESCLLYYWAGKLLPAVSFPLLLAEADLQPPPWVAAAVALLLFWAVDLWLWSRMRSRQRRIVHALSYFLDMTTAYLRAGMSLDAAIDRSIDYGIPARNPLRRELDLVRSEIRAGRSRADAFAALWPRTGVREVQSLANTLQTGFLIGSPIIPTLRDHAQLLRERVREKGQKRINRKMVEAMVPLILLNFPLMGIIVLYPPLIELGNIWMWF